MNVFEFISEINNGCFYASYNLEDEIEWKIASFYLPNGYTKALVSAVGIYGFTKDRKKAVYILKDAIKKYPNCHLLYDAILTLENENYSSDKEMKFHEDRSYELGNEEIIPEITTPTTILDIVGDRFVKGCLFFNEISAIKDKINKNREKHFEIYNKIFSSKNSTNFKSNFIEYISIIKFENDQTLICLKDSELNEIYNFLIKNNDLYFDGFFHKFSLLKDYPYLRNSYCNFGEKPDIKLLETLILDKKIINDDIFNFLQVYFEANDILAIDKRALILYSVIFEKQGYLKASRRYRQLAENNGI